MRSVLLVLAAASLTAESPPPALQPQIEKFDAALSQYRFTEAVGFLDKLIEQRTPPDGKPRPDPLLNALFGRLYLRQESAPATTYLDQATIQELPEELRVATSLDRGRALELTGDRVAALAAYREAAAGSGTAVERRRATLGIARELLPDDPAAVPLALAEMVGGAVTPERWYADYLLSASASLTGDSQAAERLADQAWADALRAPLTDLAMLHVAMLRAGLAAARHDQAAERAMLLSTNGLSLSATAQLSAQLPVCGDRGITPSDYVIFGFVSGPYGARELIPIAASRIQAVPAFADSLGGTHPIKEADGYKPMGTVFTVGCRSELSFDYTAKRSDYDPLLAWFAERGLYPASASYDSDDEHIAVVTSRIDSIAARFGQSSPLLIAPRWQMLAMLESRARAGDPVLPGQLADLTTEIAAGMRQAGAPEWLPQTVEARLKYEEAGSRSQDDPDRYTAMQDVFRNYLLRAPIGFARELLAQARSNFRGDWPAQFGQMVVDLKPNAASLTGRERQSWLLMLAEAQRTLGKTAEARATIAAAGVRGDLCMAADTAPALLDQHFSYKDYPEDLNAGAQEGAVMFDFDLSPSGKVAAPRIVYSLPSGLFDDPSAKGLTTIRYTSPTRAGKPASCRGLYQPIVWRLEGEHDFSLPRLAPELSNGVS